MFGVIVACSSNGEAPKTNQSGDTQITNVSLSEVKKSQVLNDELSLLGTIGNTIMLDENTWVLMDNSPGVYLLKDKVITRKFGEMGKGPCEYEEVSAIEANSDYVYVLDATQTKLITYNLNTEECLEEMNHDDLKGAYYLYKETDTPSFLVANTSTTMMTPDSTYLVHRIFEDEQSEPLALTFGELDAVKSLINLRSYDSGIAKHDNLVYFYLPLTDRLHFIDTDTDSIHSMPLNIDIKKEEFEKAGGDVNQILEIIRGDFDLVSKVLVGQQWIAVQKSTQSAREDDAPNMTLQFYTKEGTFINEIDTSNEVLGAEGNTLIFQKDNNDPASDFAYMVEYRDLILE